MGRPKIDRTGESIVNNQGLKMSIINCINSHNVDVAFEDGFISYNKEYDKFKKGSILNPYFPTVFNVGYFGESCVSYRHSNQYNMWRGMLRRCYSSEYHILKPSYIGCLVDECWHNFQIFVKWYDENYNPATMEGWHLDKDILVKGNKIYSPETCCFVPNEVNILFKTNNVKGYRTRPCGKKFQVRVAKFNKVDIVGDFNSICEATTAYKIAKEEYIKEVADKWRDLINPKVYEAMYNYQVEITD